MFDSRVQVDPKVKDRWGIPVARMSGMRHPHSLEIARYISNKAEAWLKEAGAVQTWKKIPGPGLSGGQHQAGTCRMGDDPKKSALNAFNQMHEVKNLFVVDGSSFTTASEKNPTLTILALSWRASDYLAGEMQRGNL